MIYLIKKLQHFFKLHLNPGTPACRSFGAGRSEVTFDAGNFPSGVYFYQLKTQTFQETKKLILIK